MASSKVIKEATSQLFAQRVAFAALQVAHDVATESPDTPNHEARAFYATQVFRGDEKAMLLMLHVVAASSVITEALENGTAEDVSDEVIKASLTSIWDARASAYAMVSMEIMKLDRLLSEAARITVEANNALAAAQALKIAEMAAP